MPWIRREFPRFLKNFAASFALFDRDFRLALDMKLTLDMKHCVMCCVCVYV